jgi:S1-C subfamily serine protease
VSAVRVGPAARRVLCALALVGLLAVDAQARSWAWLGVRIRDLSEQEMDDIAARHGIREGFGVVIVEVLEGTPAARAGVKSGDVVVAFEDHPVTETRVLQRMIAAAAAEHAARLTVLRPEGRRQLAVRLAPMPREIAGDRVAAEFGFALRDTDRPGEVAGARPLAGIPAVAVILRGSRAEKAGLEAGDLLLAIEERPVLTRDAARDALAGVSLERPLRLSIRRAQERLSLTIPPP